MNKMSIAETAWLAGLFEGEGCFMIRDKYLNNKTWKEAGMLIHMTDLDIIQRCQAITGVGRVNKNTLKSPTHKPSWTWAVYKLKDVEDLVYSILPYLGERRSSKAEEVLKIVYRNPRP